MPKAASLLKSVDAGGGWLIFALPPAEAAVHPVDGNGREQKHAGHELLSAAVYLMCNDLDAEMKKLKTRKVTCSPVETASWGKKTTFVLPSGGELGMYQPSHPTAIETKPKARTLDTKKRRPVHEKIR